MMLGYLLLYAVVLGFLVIGFKGFSATGLPLTRKTNLAGKGGKVVGTICILLGLTILGFSILDFLPPPAEKAVNRVENHVPIPEIQVAPVKPFKKSPGKPLQGLVAYWTFDKIDGTKIVDVSGHGNHAVLRGGKNASGIKGDAIYLDGKGDWVDYGDSADFTFGAETPFTVSGWIKTKQTNGTILAQRNSKSYWPTLRLELGTGFLCVYLHGDTEGTLGAGMQSGKVINDDKWHHFALVRFAEELMRLHIDGEIAGYDRSKWVTQAVTTDMRSLGSDRRKVEMDVDILEHYWFQGCLDEFCVFNRALDHGEVERLARLDADALPNGEKK